MRDKGISNIITMLIIVVIGITFLATFYYVINPIITGSSRICSVRIDEIHLYSNKLLEILGRNTGTVTVTIYVYIYDPWERRWEYQSSITVKPGSSFTYRKNPVTLANVPSPGTLINLKIQLNFVNAPSELRVFKVVVERGG